MSEAAAKCSFGAPAPPVDGAAPPPVDGAHPPPVDRAASPPVDGAAPPHIEAEDKDTDSGRVDLCTAIRGNVRT